MLTDLVAGTAASGATFSQVWPTLIVLGAAVFYAIRVQQKRKHKEQD